MEDERPVSNVPVSQLLDVIDERLDGVVASLRCRMVPPGAGHSWLTMTDSSPAAGPIV